MLAIHKLVNKGIQERLSALEGVRYQGADAYTIGSTVQPIVPVGSKLMVLQGTIGGTVNLKPTVGKKFRIYSIKVTVSKEATCADAFTVFCTDNGVALANLYCSSAALTAIGSVTIDNTVFPPWGYVANGTITFDISAAMTAGNCSYQMIYSED